MSTKTTIAATSEDIPVPADYTGSHHAEIAVWRPSNGTWYVSDNNSAAVTQQVQWGLPGDIPVPGDYTGAGHADYAVFRPSDSTWYIQGVGNIKYGKKDDIPVPSESPKDVSSEVVPAVYRRSNCTLYVRGAGSATIHTANCHTATPTAMPYNTQWSNISPVTELDVTNNSSVLYWDETPIDDATGPGFNNAYGTAGDVPVPGYYQNQSPGIISQNQAVWRPSNGTWYVNGDAVPGNSGTVLEVQWGINGDIPVPADFNGDRLTDFAVWRPSNATWYIRGIATVKFGNPY